MKPILTAQPAITAFEAILEELEAELSNELLTKLVAVHRRNVAYFTVMEQTNMFLVEKLIDNETTHNEDLLA
ncbi:MAG: hypothetical protein EAZ14_01870 [Runella slithyformis]|nr:MAG: hypothetical protein EAZ14_01870 [Runella slithyformis]